MLHERHAGSSYDDVTGGSFRGNVFEPGNAYLNCGNNLGINLDTADNSFEKIVADYGSYDFSGMTGGASGEELGIYNDSNRTSLSDLSGISRIGRLELMSLPSLESSVGLNNIVSAPDGSTAQLIIPSSINFTTKIPSSAPICQSSSVVIEDSTWSPNIRPITDICQP
jgi:hypothetical protein